MKTKDQTSDGETQQEVSGETQQEEMQTAPRDMANYRSKLTIATIGGSPERAKTEKKRVHVATFIGIATGVKIVENTNEPERPYTAVTGNFEAVNMYDGTVWRSGVLYLPGGFHEMILGMLDEIAANDDRSKFDKPQVAFALAIDAEPSDNPSGYSYVANNLAPPSKADPLAALRERAFALLPPPALKITDQSAAA